MCIIEPKDTLKKMNNTDKIMMRLLTDLYSSENEQITESYQKYYDSISNEQATI